MAKLLKCSEDRPTNEFLIAAPCAVGKFDVVGTPGAWEVEIPDTQEFAITYALAFGGWTLIAPAVWVGNHILNFNGVTNFKFSAAPKEEAPAPEPEDDTIETLQAKCDEKGVTYDKRWGKAKLIQALEA